MTQPRTQVTLKPLSYAEAKQQFGFLKLPPTARDVYVATASVGLRGGALLYRFSAPVEDCLRHAAVVIGEQARYGNGDPVSGARMDSITGPVLGFGEDDLSPYGLEDVAAWFDVEDIGAGYIFQDSSPGHPILWVDKGRQLFFYYWSD
jgi:hypothetical protein